MSSRTVHLIHTECDVQIKQIGQDTVQIRITEIDPEIIDPTDLTIEGDRESIFQIFANATDVLENFDLLAKEPN